MSRLFCMDGVNSMTGNTPDLPTYARICREYDALLYVDDAHGFGVIGESPSPEAPYGRRGNSIVRHLGETYDNLVLVGGFSKSYSSLLAFLALPTGLKNHLKVAAAPYLYSGPSPTASLATVLAGLRVNELEGDEVRLALSAKTARVLDRIRRARALHPQHLGAPHHRTPARRGGRHRCRRALPLRPGNLRDAGGLSAGTPVTGRLPDPDHGGQRRRRDRAAQRGPRRAGGAIHHAAVLVPGLITVGLPSLVSPLRRRDFRLLWTGMSVSLLGDGIFLVAIAWQAFALSNRPSSLAYVGVAISLPQVAMLLVGGAVSDRRRCRTVLFWADGLRALAVGALAVLTVSGGVRLWELYLTGAVLGVGAAFAFPAFDALVPQLVPERDLTQANAIEQSVRPATAQLAGPALGGLAVAVVGTAGALGVDALTFVFSAGCVLRMSRLPPVTAPVDRRGLGHDMREGLGYVRRHVWLWGTFLAATFTYLLFLGPTEVLLPYIVRNSLHQSATAYGIVLAAGGVGALVGALLMGRAGDRRRPVTWIYAWWTVATLGVAGYGLFMSVWGLVVAALVVNGAEAVGAVVWVTLKQRQVPMPLMGRVSSIDWLVSIALLPLSYALTPPVSHLLGARTTLVLAGTAGAAVTLSFLFLPGMRDPERSPPADPGGRRRPPPSARLNLRSPRSGTAPEPMTSVAADAQLSRRAGGDGTACFRPTPTRG